jgi:hypothetical protein
MTTNVLRNAVLTMWLVLGAQPTPAAVAAARVYVGIAPPAPIVEVRPVAPEPGVVWIDGYYRWDGHGYVWVPGRWVHPPRVGAHWVAGRWVHNGRGWYSVAGHWR